MPHSQHGGACSLCGAEGANKATCPFNPAARNPNPAKHGADPVEKPATRAVAPAKKAVKKAPSKPRKVPAPGNRAPAGKMVKDGRLSAGEYYRTHGPSCVGDICDIRGNGEYKCLLLRSNGVPYWAAPSKSGVGQEACQPWKPKCKE